MNSTKQEKIANNQDSHIGKTILYWLRMTLSQPSEKRILKKAAFRTPFTS